MRKAPKVESNAAKGRKLAIAMLRAHERAPDPNVLWADKTWRDKGRRQKNVCAPFLRSLAESPELAEGFGSMLTHILMEFDQGTSPNAHGLAIREKAGLFDQDAPGEAEE